MIAGAGLDRPIGHLEHFTAVYDRPWKQFEVFRAGRGEGGAPSWPGWCYCPLAGAHAVLSQTQLPPAMMASQVGPLGALAAWRVTKGIYTFHEAAEAELWSQPVAGDLPTEVLERLPEWCPYISLAQPRPIFQGRLHGFWVHLEHDANDHRRELRFVLDCNGGEGRDVLLGVPLHLGGTLQQAIERAVGENAWQGKRQGATAGETPLLDRQILEPLVSLTLYLCAANAELRSGELEGPQSKPREVQNGKTRRIPPPREPRIWEVAFTAGSALQSLQVPGDGTGVRPHVRRAHWHTYLVGEGRQRRELRWIAPTLVGEGEIDPSRRDVE